MSNSHLKHYESLSLTRQRIYRIQHFKTFAAATENLQDMYQLLNEVSADVFALYPHISCVTGCNTCCKGTSMPTVSAAEWVQLHQHLMTLYTAEQRTALIERMCALYNPHKAVYWRLHDTLQTPPTPEQLAELKVLLPRLSQNQCPFLVDESCSVYENRPAKCRAHGAFLIQLGEHVQLKSCDSEVEKMEAYLVQQGSRNVTLPLWNSAEIKIKEAYNAPGTLSTVLPIWLVTHLHEGKLLAEANPTPDFEAFRDRDIVKPLD